MRTLVVGDAHVTNDQDLSRFKLLSNLIIREKPDNIVIIGDFLSLNSLSAWDADKRKIMEGQRYAKEIQAGNDALNYMFEGVLEYNSRMTMQKHKRYLPNVYYTEGNHENRLTRYFDKNPIFEGHVSIEKDLWLHERGIEYVPYSVLKEVDGVSYVHIPHNGFKAISGAHILYKVANLYALNVVFGHTHKLEYMHRQIIGVGKCNYLNVGSFMSDDVEHYMAHNIENYFKGVVIVDNTDGVFQFTTFPMNYMEVKYG